MVGPLYSRWFKSSPAATSLNFASKGLDVLMRKNADCLELTATDLVGFLNCRHLSFLDLAVAEGSLSKPYVWEPLLRLLWERGLVHEAQYVEYLSGTGLEVARIASTDIAAEAETLAAMKAGVPAIVQGAFSYDGWVGRPDVLRRVEVPSALGSWSYEPIDTKLARETKARTILQLCVYGGLLHQAQGVAPEFMYVVPPWSEFQPQQYRFTDYAAFFRKAKHALRRALSSRPNEVTYPEPTVHCDVCRWRVACDQRRRDDDHLSLVANITKIQINELRRRGVTTVKALASLPLPLEWKPERGSAQAHTKSREQARLQVEGREAGINKFELLPIEVGFGLTRLPEPSAGDVFFDLEGDPFVGEHGLEYLFGYHFRDKGQWEYRGEWAFTREDERRAFERFVDFVMAQWQTHPDLHVYHYAPYEPAALKRLMGRYATREEEIDQMLRARLFVDLYGVVRHSIRASVESYSIKRLEPFYSFGREAALTDANVALANLQANLELNDAPSIPGETKAVVRAYNQDDCRSTAYLRDWLETLRRQVVAGGTEVPRPNLSDSTATENVTDWIIKVGELAGRLTAGVPDDPEVRSEEQQARWILANILDWHRREQKAAWWEYFRLSDLSADELRDERAGLSGLEFIGVVDRKQKTPIHRYSLPPQETELRGGEQLNSIGGASFGTLEAISFSDWTIDIKKRKDTADVHPEAVFAHKVVGCPEQQNALLRIGEHVGDHGLHDDGGPYLAARDLLLRAPPRLGGAAIREPGETTLEAAIRLCGQLDGGILPIQGPPGAGKTYTGAHMICELVRRGKTVGITANSHKVIRNLIDKTIEAADELGVDLHCCHKADEPEAPQHRLSFAQSNADLLDNLGGSIQVGGGTAWLWSRQDATESVDVLFVDEAAQMSLANVLAVSQAARTVVLIGDPQQLDQPMQGSHPEGTDVSALAHILGGVQIIPPEEGLFLAETWRLHPSICEYTSELFYADKLKPKAGLERQVIKSSGAVNGAGLRYLPVAHTGNQNCSPEEAKAVADLVKGMVENGATWVDADGKEHLLTLDDIMVITPYNAQVFEIQQRLPGIRVGTVDKFQGQQAPIAIYSTATSSHADAPRGMEFLYSLNRLNVATSRARCMSILVSSPQLFEAECWLCP
jgi:uncharacterized protein